MLSAEERTGAAIAYRRTGSYEQALDTYRAYRALRCRAEIYMKKGIKIQIKEQYCCTRVGRSLRMTDAFTAVIFYNPVSSYERVL